jgi:hypothetical protein
VKTGCDVAESSKEGYGSKRAVLPMMMVICDLTRDNNILIAKMLFLTFQHNLSKQLEK